MEELKDEEYRLLLERIGAGEQQAFAKLYDIFWVDLLDFLLRKVDDKQVAEDIVHDIFVSLWKKRERLLDIESVPAYLYSACRYKIFDYHRQRYGQQLGADEALVQIADSAESIDDILYYRYLLDMVEKEIENLPEKCKEVFKLSRFSYLSNKEIAEKLAISESTVENHINKAVKRLRRISGAQSIFFHLFL